MAENTIGGADPKGPQQTKVDRGSWLKTIADTAIPLLIDAAAQKYLGGIKLDAKSLGVGTAASTVLNKALDIFKGSIASPTGSTVKPNAKFLTDAGLEIAKAFLQDRAVTAAGEPEKDASLQSILDPRKTYYTQIDPKSDLYKLAASAGGHLVSTLFDRLHIGSFGLSVKASLDDAIRKSTDLSKAESWVQLAKDVAVGVLNDKNRDVIGYLAGLTPAAETKTNGTGAGTSTADAGTPLPPKSDATAQASSGARRASASTNAFATYFQNRAVGSKDDKEAKKNVEELVMWGAKQLGVSDGVAKANLEKAIERLQPLFAKAKDANEIGALAIMLQELAKQSEAASKKDPTAANRFARYKMMANCASAIAQRFAQAGLNADQISPSVARRLDRFMDFAVANLVAQSLGVPHKAAKWTKDEVLYLEKNQQDLETLTNVLFDERIYRKMQVRRASAERPNVGYPIHDSIDLKNPKASATKLAALLVGEAAKEIPADQKPAIRTKLQAALETILSKGNNNIDVACGALDWLSQQVPDKKILQPLFALVATTQAPVEQCTMVLQRLTDAAKTNFERQKSLGADIEKFTKAIADLKTQPDTKDRNDAIAKSQAAIKAAQTELENAKQEKTKIESTIKEFSRELTDAKTKTNDVVDQMFRQVRGFIAAPDKFLAQMAEWQKQIDGSTPKAPDGSGGAGAGGAGGAGGGPLGPGANGPGGPAATPGNGAGWASSTSRRQIEIQQRRAYECAQVLADPALSIQDKIFLFMMIYASFADQEREEKLRELNTLEEHKAEWDARRQDLSTVCEERLKAVNGIKEQVDQKRTEIQGLKDQGVGDTDPRMVKANNELAGLEQSRDASQKNYTMAVNEYEQKAQEVGPSKNREALFLELQRVSQWRDQIMQMARSMLEESNRLVERIWR